MNVGINIINKEAKSADADEIMEAVTYPLYEFVFSKAEIFYMDCHLTNPKDVWNEFTFINNSNFECSC